MNRSKIVRTSTALMACALFHASTAAAQDFILHFRDGLVTLVAQDVSVPTILNWWGRIGSATVVNAEKVEGPPVTLRLVDVPEGEALAILLRNAGGYILAPRHEDLQGVSVFERILVVPARSLGSPALPPAQVARLASPLDAAASSGADAGVAKEEAVGAANQSAEVAVFPPSLFGGSASGAGAARFAPRAVGPTGAPVANGLGTARPGEVAAPPPRTRLSAGPQRPPE
jgi:hypothetical protein